MRTYEYKGFTAEGRAARGLVEAESKKEARAKLAAEGVLAEKVEASERHMKLDTAARASLYRELGELLSAGLPIVKSLETMMKASDSPSRGVVLARLRDDIREGKSLSQSLAAASRSVGRFEQALIESAEQSSAMEVMLSRLADFLEERDALKDKVQTALIYPILIITLGTSAAIVMLGVLIPRVVDALGTEVEQLPILTRLMMTFGTMVFRWGWIALVLVAAAVLHLVRKIKHDASFAARVDAFLFRVPILGRGYRILACQRFARTMAMLLDGGVAAIDAVVLSGRATGSRWLAGLCAEQADEVRHGRKLSEAMHRIPVLSDAVAEWVAVGEATGGLSRMTARAGERYSRMWESYIARVMGIIQPAILIVVGGFVILVTLSIMLPIMSLGRLAGG